MLVSFIRRHPALLKLAKRVVNGLRSFRLPLPRLLNPLLLLLFHVQAKLVFALRWLLAVLVYEPLFRGRCARAGRRLRVTKMPFVVGGTRIEIGDDVNLFGKVDIVSGHSFTSPSLIIGNRVDLGHEVAFLVNRRIEIEDDVNIASRVRFMDSDAHPRDTAARIANLGPPEDEIKPVKICRYAWIGQNSFVLKGVTIGEGAIVGVGSVVISDIPPYSVAMGNPARVVIKNLKPVASEAPAPDPLLGQRLDT